MKEETKVCNICGEEKPINECLSNQNICKVCDYLKRHKDIIVNENWTLEEYRIILDNILNNKVEYINEICQYLNVKTLKQLCLLLNSNLKIAGKNIRIKEKCINCNIDIAIKLYQYLDNQQHFCSSKCNGKYQAIINNKDKITLHKKICQYCGKEFKVSTARVTTGKDKYCSAKCSQDSQINKIKFNCDYCGIKHEFTLTKYNRSTNHFCGHKCADKFRTEQAREVRKCEICGKNFGCLKSVSQKMCSIECQGKWQSINLSGENANGYNHDVSKVERTITCKWCKTPFEVQPYDIDHAKFCSKKCRQEWFAQEYSQTTEFRENASVRAVKMLEDNMFCQRITGIQSTVNSILDKLNIDNISEKAFGKVAMDNFLTESGLMIENMGTFYHCDYRKYQLITYERHVNRIRMDKTKHSYIRNNHNVEILYLWEEDITNNVDLCEALILFYIQNEGKLDNYHSFNYKYKNNTLHLKDDVIKPYMEWDIDNLKQIIDIKVQEKMSRKQQDKWIRFECEQCGKEKEQLILHYNKNQHHYCSRECSAQSQMNRVHTSCINCSADIEMIKSLYDKNEDKIFYCGKDCKIKFKENNIISK